ncbi:MAG: hypothetical protein Roseis2KO_32470 [Roseivirga sp.]
MTNGQEMASVPLLERINVKKAYFLFGAIVFVISVIATLATPELGITNFIGPNISYHLIFWAISFTPRLFEGSIPTKQHAGLNTFLKVFAYLLLLANAILIGLMIDSIFMKDVERALILLSTFSFGLGGIKIYQYAK